MKHPIILEGDHFDWGASAEISAKAVDVDGNVNWKAAFAADPGVMKCPNCKEFLWDEGTRVRCPDCNHEWTVDDAR